MNDGYGEGPMPNSWSSWMAWALSPYRVMLLMVNTLILTFTIFLGHFSIPLAIAEGLALLWFMERLKEGKDS